MAMRSDGTRGSLPQCRLWRRDRAPVAKGGHRLGAAGRAWQGTAGDLRGDVLGVAMRTALSRVTGTVTRGGDAAFTSVWRVVEPGSPFGDIGTEVNTTRLVYRGTFWEWPRSKESILLFCNPSGGSAAEFVELRRALHGASRSPRRMEPQASRHWRKWPASRPSDAANCGRRSCDSRSCSLGRPEIPLDLISSRHGMCLDPESGKNRNESILISDSRALCYGLESLIRRGVRDCRCLFLCDNKSIVLSFMRARCSNSVGSGC